MKHIICFLLAIISPMVASAQANRVVMGLAHDEAGEPVPGVTIIAEGVSAKTVSGPDGRFEISIPYSCRTIKGSHADYLEATAEVDGSFVVITMRMDPSVVAAKLAAPTQFVGIVKDQLGEPISGVTVSIPNTESKTVSGSDGKFSITGPGNTKELVAVGDILIPKTVPVDGPFTVIIMELDVDAIQKREQIAASRQQAMADSLKAAEIALQKELKQQQKERERFVADSLKAAKYAEEMLLKNYRDSVQTAARAIADSIRMARRDSLTAIRKKAIARNDSLYRNHGLVASVELGYNKQLAMSGEVIYQNYGYKTYGDTVPIEIDFMLGYRFSNALTLSVGAGFLYEMDNLAAYGDTFSKEVYGGISNYANFDIPAFLNLKWFMSRSKVQPMLSLSGGLYLMSKVTLINAGLGFNVRVSHDSNMYLLANVGYTPWPRFVSHSPLTYDNPLTIGGKIGWSF